MANLLLITGQRSPKLLLSDAVSGKTGLSKVRDQENQLRRWQCHSVTAIFPSTRQHLFFKGT